MFRLVERDETRPIRPDALAKHVGSAGLPGLLKSLRGPRPQTLVCPLCGWTDVRYDQSKLLGCGLCYTVFEDLIAPNIDQDPS